MYNFRLTEEIARWAFEVNCHKSPNWYISFTNPTAGPWKTIKGLDKNGVEGEVYRFELEETRPDIILVNDTLKLIIIFEAKDCIEKLTSDDQAYKSVELVNTLSSLLKNTNAKTNIYWGERANYTILTGLLWGAEKQTSYLERSNTFDKYHDNMKNFPLLSSFLIVGIETRRNNSDLECYFCGKTYGNVSTYPDLNTIAKSFNLSVF